MHTHTHTVPDTQYLLHFVHCYYSFFIIHEQYKHSLSNEQRTLFVRPYVLASISLFGLLVGYRFFSGSLVLCIATVYAYICWMGGRDPSKWKFNRMNGLDRLVHRKIICFLFSCWLFTISNSASNSTEFSTKKECSRIYVFVCVWVCGKCVNCGKGNVRNICHYSVFHSFPKVPFKWIDRKLNIR